MKSLLVLALLPSMAVAQFTIPQRGGIATPPPCVAPTMTYRWTPTSGCSTSTACATDQVSGNNAFQTNSGDLPTYGATAGPNSQPALTFNGTSDYLLPTTAIPSGLTNVTLYAVVNATSLTLTGENPIFGISNNNAMLFQLNTSGNPQFEQYGVASASSTQTVSTGTWYTLVVTYANGTTTTNFYSASGGSLTAEGSVTSPGMSFSNPTTALAGELEFGGFFAGKIAEWGYLNSVNTTGIASWSSCHYGV
jgi:hypothetical protein